MKQELAKTETVSDQELTLHLENLGLIKDLTKGELNSYLQIAKAFNLNPFKREIHVSKYNNQMSIITGYEVYIKRAERTGLLDGWSVTTEGSIEGKDLKAVLTIFRKDRSHPFIWEADYSEFVQKTGQGAVTKFWQKGKMMIKKVAISQGFRLCFSDELGGMPYTADEIPEKTEDVQHTEIITAPTSTLLKPEAKPVFDQKKAEEIESFIKGLEVCSTKKDLTEYKKIVPADIVADHKFIAAAKKRFSEVVLIESVK
jgi:phage recombination protein Bet